ncbi:flagellar hook-basal body complex protein FliE [Aliiglaciecola sp. CAU 1673]|uniref:flagellar hook-basal body complex protein FliE n=1 Tax=Aliiglaciecola sp. CAU 1673 TaxID=3032595 RepID=UPI0023DC17EC|nr:flagellar hook-basal body complex protein FliE [Aliiglaciecola sp. CAU 1673]MDF2178294.1 flagellar hook-basal body complex protein FliE [Aliiglaciecola sp. CAU 1673]
MDIKAQSLYSELQSLASQASKGIGDNLPQVTNSSGQDFAGMLKQALDTVNGMQKTSKEMQVAFEMGDPNISLADVMVAKEKSGIAFEATMQVRNKLLEAYKSISNMPV